MLYGLVLAVHIFVCFVLIAVILLQAGRGGGLADTFGGGAAQSLFGTRGTVYLTRATTACAVVFMSTSLALALLSIQRGRSLMENLPVKNRPPAAAADKQPAQQKEPAEHPQQPNETQAPPVGKTSSP